jgi:hypothetical protein
MLAHDPTHACYWVASDRIPIFFNLPKNGKSAQANRKAAMGFL